MWPIPGPRRQPALFRAPHTHHFCDFSRVLTSRRRSGEVWQRLGRKRACGSTRASCGRGAGRCGASKALEPRDSDKRGPAAPRMAGSWVAGGAPLRASRPPQVQGEAILMKTASDMVLQMAMQVRGQRSAMCWPCRSWRAGSWLAGSPLGPRLHLRRLPSTNARPQGARAARPTAWIRRPQRPASSPTRCFWTLPQPVCSHRCAKSAWTSSQPASSTAPRARRRASSGRTSSRTSLIR